MKIDRKGISPLIASVLMIAFVLTIAGVFSEWGNDLVLQSTDDNTEQQDQLLNCNDRGLNIVSVNEDYGNNQLIVTIQDEGGQIGNVTVTAFPSLTRGYVSQNLTTDNQVETVTLSVGSQQDRVEVSAQSCPLSTSETLG